MNTNLAKSILSKTILHLCLAGCIALAFFAPGWLYSFIKPVHFQLFSWKYFFIFYFFALILTLIRSSLASSLVVVFLAILELSQFSSIAYFGEFINPFAIQQMFIEMADVAEASLASLQTLYYIVILVLLPYTAIILSLWLTRRFRWRLQFMWIAAVLFLLFPTVRIVTHTNHKDMMKFFPVLSYPTLANTLNSYSAWAVFILPERTVAKAAPHFQPITVTKTDKLAEKTTVIVVMGESFTANHMSAFGYTRPTTPRLSEWQNRGELLLLPGYSASIATRTTMPAFFNVEYNPLNTAEAYTQPANLFNLAKANGFTNIYISAQRGNCLNGISTKNIDTLIAYEQQSDVFDSLRDEALLTTLQKLAKADRQFIVLHQRNAHAPYERNYRRCADCFQYPIDDIDHEQKMINSYDNAVLYNDLIWTNILAYAKSLEGDVHVFLTSDHGELFGENGLWGHNHLNMDVVSVPVGYYSNSRERNVRAKLAATHHPTHYEVARLVAETLGYAIDNPNLEPDVFYANGLASFGTSGYIQFRRSEDGQVQDARVIYPK